jgi:hypothetical protein
VVLGGEKAGREAWDILPTLGFLEIHEKFLIPFGTKNRGGDNAEYSKVQGLKGFSEVINDCFVKGCLFLPQTAA